MRERERERERDRETETERQRQRQREYEWLTKHRALSEKAEEISEQLKTITHFRVRLRQTYL